MLDKVMLTGGQDQKCQISPDACDLLRRRRVRLTGLEESLIRFYESEYPAELPKKILLGGALFFDPESPAAFAAIHARHQAAVAGPQGNRERFARVIAVTSGKGGVGKTNLALNLAIELQRQGKRAWSWMRTWACPMSICWPA
jgi:Flp pilus assembly CpaE family ATPase